MSVVKPTRFFLGANSGSGFYSLYDGLIDPAAGEFLWVIKGGPGCGKSTFMKRIGAAAEKAGLPVEYIHCSGDPDSLDGVYLPAQREAFVDGTAPHVIECSFPGAASAYLDMSRFLDVSALRGKLPEIRELNRSYKALYQTAYDRLSAGSALLAGTRICEPEAEEALEKRVRKLASSELPKSGGSAQVKRRFLSAWSCKGRLTLEETISALCDRVYILESDRGLGARFLSRFAQLAQERGCRMILCPDPLFPATPEAVLLPERSLALVSAGKAAVLTIHPERRLHLDNCIGRERLRAQRTRMRESRKEAAILLSSAVSALAEAKELHDTLELCYRPHVDFEGASKLAEEHIRRLFF